MDNETKNSANGADQDQNSMVFEVLAQYVKDASFENPNAPESLRADQGAPAININIEVARDIIAENMVEVIVYLKAEAKRDDKIVYIAELKYAGLFAFGDRKADDLQPLILIECPRLLFPFARQIMSEMTQNGGFQPLLLPPPDFPAMFREELTRRAINAGEDNA